MAYQHFYSRVPAKVSMYNRSDGFDTFAHSTGLEREFIEKELAVVYQNKLGKGDVASVRRGEHPSVYLQCPLRSGNIVQACTTYLPLDYTGERSAYMTHSLILDESDRAKAFADKSAYLFNPELFVKDISSFNITSPDSNPNSEYPALDYITAPLAENDLTEKYSPETLKAFIYAMISAMRGKGKNIFFRLPASDSELSLAAVDFINKITSIFPRRFKESLSFVSYITDYAQYPSFKLKCVSERCGEFQTAKGVLIDLEADLVVGVSSDDLASNKSLINFFYYLLEHDSARERFLDYTDHAVSVMPSLESPSIKVLSEIVFLFCASSGIFDESTVIPNDAALYDALCIYDKYRDIISADYRSNVYRALERYPSAHTAIPKNIFARLVKLYPTECDSAKMVVMDTVLKLIHTDIMRDKLFGFIRSNYEGETAKRRAIINDDLARVFYGGFLQTQIIEFFSANFAEEPNDTKDTVIEKLFLAIRTENISTRIIDFIDLHYGELTQKHKQMLYDTFFEMLREADGLAANLVSLVNKHIDSENAALTSRFDARLTDALDKDKAHRLMPLLVSNDGRTKRVALSLIFGEWESRRIHSEYISLLKNLSFGEKSRELTEIYSSYVPAGSAQRKRLNDQLEAIFENDLGKVGLDAWLGLDESFCALDASLCAAAREKLIYRAISESFLDVFKAKYGRELALRTMEYCRHNISLSTFVGYAELQKYNRMAEAIERKDAKECFAALCELSENAEMRADIAEYVNSFVYDKQSLDAEKNMLAELAANALSAGLATDRVYSTYKKIYSQQYLIKHGAKANPQKAEQEGSLEAMNLLWHYLSDISSAGEGARALLANESTELDKALASFSADLGRSAEKWISQNSQNACDELRAFFDNFEKSERTSNGGFFAKLFGKK